MTGPEESVPVERDEPAAGAPRPADPARGAPRHATGRNQSGERGRPAARSVPGSTWTGGTAAAVPPTVGAPSASGPPANPPAAPPPPGATGSAPAAADPAPGAEVARTTTVEPAGPADRTRAAATSGAATTAVAGVTATADTAIRAPSTPAGPEPGRPPSTGPSAAAPDGRRSRSGRIRPLPGLRIGRHVAADSALERIRPSATESGLLLGWDEDKQPVMIRLFRSEATRMTLVGGLWISRVLVFRALGVGARVAIVTSRPEIWQEFGRWATGGDQRVAVLPPDHRLAVTASSLLPVLFLYDGELLAPAQRPDLGPWQTQLTVLRQLTPYGFPAMQEANLVAVQRLAAEEAAAASSVLRMSRRATSWLTLMRYDMLALLAGGGDEYLWVTPTPIELERFGPVSR